MWFGNYRGGLGQYGLSYWKLHVKNMHTLLPKLEFQCFLKLHVWGGQFNCVPILCGFRSAFLSETLILAFAEDLPVHVVMEFLYEVLVFFASPIQVVHLVRVFSDVKKFIFQGPLECSNII